MTTFVCFYDLTRLIDYLLLTLAHVFKKVPMHLNVMSKLNSIKIEFQSILILLRRMQKSLISQCD